MSWPVGGLRMVWVVRLVETRPDGPERSLDVLELGQLRDLGDIADLGLTLAEAKQFLSRLQQAVIAAQSLAQAVHRPTCSSCGGHCRVKDWRHTIKWRRCLELRRFASQGSAVLIAGIARPGFDGHRTVVQA